MSTTNPTLPRSYKIENLLRDEQMKISGASNAASAVSGWIVSEATDPISSITLTRSTVEKKWDPASLEVFIESNDDIRVITNDSDIPVTEGAIYRAFCWVRTRALSVPFRIGIEWRYGNTVEWSASTYSNVQVNGAAGWTLASFTGVAPVNVQNARVRIEFPFVGDTNPYNTAYDYQTYWIDDVVFTEYSVPDNGFMRLIQRDLPEYMLLLDQEQESPSSPMLRFMNLIGATANKMMNASLGFDYVPASDDLKGFDRCTLVEQRFYPTDDIAEERWLPWLAYVTATTPYISTLLGGGATPWFALEGFETATPPITWQQLEAQGDTPPTWSQIAALNPTPIPSINLLTEAIRSKGTGTLAGTREGLRRAARLVLTDDESFDVPCSLTVSNNVVTVVINSIVANTAAMAASGVNLYDTGVTALDNDYSTNPVSYSTSGGKTTLSWTATETVDDIAVPVYCYVTDRRVEISSGDSIWEVNIAASAAQNPDPSGTLLLDVASKAKAAGVKLNYIALA